MLGKNAPLISLQYFLLVHFHCCEKLLEFPQRLKILLSSYLIAVAYLLLLS